MKKIKKLSFRLLRILGWTWLAVVGVLLLITLLIQVPAVQQSILQKTAGYLQEKIGTKVSLDHVSLHFPGKITLEGIYLEDRAKDTLLYAGALAVKTNLWALAARRIELNEVVLQDLTGAVSRTEDSVFNFDYIVRAFAGDTVKQDTAQAPWEISLEALSLKNIRLSYRDAVTQDAANLQLDDLTVSLDEFDLINSVIHVDDVSLSGVTAGLTQKVMAAPAEQPAGTGESASSFPFDIDFNSTELKDIRIAYDNPRVKVSLDLARAVLKSERIDLRQHKIALEDFELYNTFLAFYRLDSLAAGPQAGEEGAEESEIKTDPWQLSLNNLKLEGNSVQYYDFTKAKQGRGLDPDHLWFSNIGLEVAGLRFGEHDRAATIHKMSLHEHSGFGIRSAQGAFRMTDRQAESDFSLQTYHSTMRMEASARYASPAALTAHFWETRVKAVVKETGISRKDIDLLAPALLDSLPVNLPAVVHLEAAASGTPGDLTIDSLSVRTLTHTVLAVAGSVKGLPDVRKAAFDIDLHEFRTVHEDVRLVVPAAMLPQSLALPQWLSVTGRFSGTMDTPAVAAHLACDLGAVDVQAQLTADTVSGRTSYRGEVAVSRFNVGKLLGRPQTMGSLDMEASVDGAGLTMEDLDAQLRATVRKFAYNDYTYKDLVIDGAVKKYLFSGSASMNDPNLAFRLDGDLDYNYAEKERAYHFTFTLENADLEALHWSARPLKTRFTLAADLDNADPDNLNGTLAIRDVAVYNGERLYKVDSLLFASVRDSTRTELTLSSDVVQGTFKGSFDLFRLPGVMQQYFHTYYALHDTVRAAGMEPQQFTFDLTLTNTSLLTEILVPELERFVPGEIKGAFNSENRDLSVHIAIKDIAYSSVAARDLLFTVSSDHRQLNYSFSTGHISAAGIDIPSLALEGVVADDSVMTNFVVYDSLDEEKYRIGGVFRSREEHYAFRFIQDQVLLNYDSWSVPPGNYVEFGPSGILARHMELSHGSEKIRLEAARDSAVSLVMDHLDLRSLASLASQDTLLSGMVDGRISLHTARSKRSVEAAMSITGLAMNKGLVGDVRLDISREKADRYDVALGIKGPGTDVDITGSYTTHGPEPALDVQAGIASLNLATIQPLLQGQVKESSGTLTGRLDIKGTPARPGVNGSLTFKEASVTPSYINSKLLLHDETLVLDGAGIVFKDFEVRDEQNNPIHLTGRVEAVPGQEVRLNVRVSARNFLILNTTEEDNDLFYGKVRINTEARITGTGDLPRVDMEASLGEASEFTYVVPQAEAGVMAREGIVEFIDKDVAQDPFLASLQKDRRIVKDTATAFKGIALTANIELSDKETFHIVIDPVTEDRLTVKGNTTLTLDIDPTGNMNLAGRYELSEGSYSLTFYKLVKRTFAIEKGSTITWSGDPLDAALDITATYRVETSPMELFSNQLTGVGQEQIDRYRQRIPFLVHLLISGRLLSPDIGFSLDMPANQQNIFGGNVYARLQDINSRESDLNKQVFALLILKRFVSDNPFEHNGGATLTSTARRSVSRLLSEQLNRLSGNIKGVELSFDLKAYEAYTDGQAENRTQLELGFSKNLFDERLVVKLSGNVNLEGEQGAQNDVSDYLGDLALEYKLTEDGRFRVTGFRNSDYNMIDGELKETGIGFIYIKDYDSLRELFKANATKNKNP